MSRFSQLIATTRGKIATLTVEKLEELKGDRINTKEALEIISGLLSLSYIDKNKEEKSLPSTIDPNNNEHSNEHNDNEHNSNEHDYVEIAGIKWATMNIGANSITDTGLYFQWGDTQGYTAAQVGNGEGQKYFNENDCIYYNDGNYIKYNSTDGKITLEPTDDAVTAAWGGNWRMPTVSEFTALGEAVTSVWTDDYQGSGVAGLVCTDKTDNSKVLFFPACGSTNYGSVDYVGSDGSYWSSLLDVDYGDSDAYLLYFSNDSTYLQFNSSRYNGFPVRGVLAEQSHDYVEIGGIKWATMNLGASSVTDPGLYYQWGDTQGYTTDQIGSGEGQKYFGQDDYKYYNNGEYTKYNSTDELYELLPEDDAATVAWGGNWRMPTISEIQALEGHLEYTTNYQETGVSGLIYTDYNDNSKTLFFPCGGYIENGSLRDNEEGTYWTNSVGTYSGDNFIFGLRFYNLGGSSFSGDMTVSIQPYIGCTIRPVLDDSNS